MMDLANRVGELDRRAGPIKMPSPLQNLPAWSRSDAAQRSAGWGGDLARAAARNALRNGIRIAMNISPLGRIGNTLDLFGLSQELTYLTPPGPEQPDFTGQGWTYTQCSGGTANYWADNFQGCVAGTFWIANDNPTSGVGYKFGSRYGIGVYQLLPVYNGSDTTTQQAVHVGHWRKYVATGEVHQPVPIVSTPGTLGFDNDPLFNPLNQVAVNTAPAVRGANPPYKPPYVPVKPRTRPRNRELERKAQTHGPGIRAIKRIVNFITETLDVANCAYDALPDHIVGRKAIPPKPAPNGGKLYAHETPLGIMWKSTPPDEPAKRDPFRRTHNKIDMIIRNLDEIDLNKMIECAVMNQVEDRVIGSLASAAGPFGGKYGRPIGFTSGPAL